MQGKVMVSQVTLQIDKKMYLSYKYLSKVVLFFDIEQPESLNSYKVKISVVAYVMKRQSLNESGNTSSFTGCF